MLKYYTYRIIIEPDEGNTYHGYVPALSGCHTWGNSIEEVRRNIKDAINAHIASLIEDGELVPEDRGIELFETISQPDLQNIS